MWFLMVFFFAFLGDQSRTAGPPGRAGSAVPASLSLGDVLRHRKKALLRVGVMLGQGG